MDWIRARRKCSIEHAWNTLCERLRTDIDIWTASSDGTGPTIECSVDGGTAVITKNSPHANTAKITLRWKSHHIVAELPPGQHNSIILTPLVNESGECRLSTGGAELEFWQASRKILEKFLFGDGEA